MLVLSRKIQESVVVGGSDGFERLLKVTVLEIGGGRVRLGFEVEKEVPVHRSEVWERIQRLQASALNDGADDENGRAEGCPDTRAGPSGM
jgi:carbon storage regulator